MRRWAMAVLTLAAVMGGCDKVYVTDQNVVMMDRQALEAAQQDRATVIVDVRKPEKYAAGHIPGAINIYLPLIQAGDPRLGLAQRIVVYSEEPTDPLGRAAAKRMIALGYQNVNVYLGGVEFWTRNGGQLVQSTAPSKQRAESGGKN